MKVDANVYGWNLATAAQPTAVEMSTLDPSEKQMKKAATLQSN
jgi:hypothetical protein